MLEYKQKQRRKQTRQLMYSTPALFLLGIATVLMGVSSWKIYTKAYDTRQNLAEINEVYTDLYAREQDLAASVEALNTPFGVEAEIRDKYGLIKEGEETIVIVDETSKKGENQEAEKEEGWWQKVKDIF